MLRRKIDELFDNLAVKKRKKTFFIEGARQIGKTASNVEIANGVRYLPLYMTMFL